MRRCRAGLVLLSLLVFPGSPICVAQAAQNGIGVFTAQQDIGTVLHAGSATFDAARGAYTITGSGDNVWATSDDLHFVWKKVESKYGNDEAVLSAQIDFANSGGNPHKKAMLMIRQSLDPDSAYVDVARHGNGLTSLQYRGVPGDVTREIQLNVSGPPKVRIARSGDFFFVWYAGADGRWIFSGASISLPMKEPYYVGLGMCSHDKDASETAVFSNVKLVTVPDVVAISKRWGRYSTLEVVPTASADRRVVYTAATPFEAPVWLKDNSGFLVCDNGHVELIGSNGEATAPVDKGRQACEKSDRAVSPDGKWAVAWVDGTGADGHRGAQYAILQLTRLADGKTTLLAQLSRGPGTLTMGSWSPDSTSVVFVSYMLVPNVEDWD